MKPHLIIPDLHGNYEALNGLLHFAGALDDEGDRNGEIFVVQLGDLANAVFEDQNADATILRKAPDLIDVLLIGNHELPWIYGADMGFNGFHDNTENGTLYRSYVQSGFVQPAHLIEEHNLLLTHAGVAEDFPFESASEAYFDIMKAYKTPRSGWEKLGTAGSTPLRYLMKGVGYNRGGRDMVSSIFWKDWQEPANKNFSQIVGHTVQRKGTPAIHERADGTYNLCIDCGGHVGTGATACLLQEDGSREYLRWDPPRLTGISGI